MTQRGHALFGVDNSILEFGHWGGRLKSNGDLGGKWGVEAPFQKVVAWHTLAQQGGRRKWTVQEIVMGVDGIWYVAKVNAWLLEDGKGKYLVRQGK